MNLSAETQELKEMWTALFPSVTAPEDSQWALWFLKHDAQIVRRGIVEFAVKHRRLKGKMDSPYMGKFASAVMNRLSIRAFSSNGTTATLKHQEK